MNDTKFVVNNYEGVTVTCSNERWEHAKRHFTDDNDETLKSALKGTIKDPECVGKSDEYSNREIYTKAISRSSQYYPLSSVVVVEYGYSKNGNVVGELVTAYPKKIKGGKIKDDVYKKPHN